MKKVFIWSFIVFATLNFYSNRAVGAEYHVAGNGNFSDSIVTSVRASEGTKEAALLLQNYLEKIVGTPIAINQTDAQQGIVVGKVDEYPQFSGVFNLEGLSKPEHYLLKSHDKGIYLIGVTDIGVRHAVWDFLHQIGYRYYFPGKHWEIIPHKSTLSIDIDKVEHPDFLLRHYFVGYSTGNPKLWPGQQERWEHWREANRLVRDSDSGKTLTVESGHRLQVIYGRNKSVFDKHPEYLALVNGKRGSSPPSREKYCLSQTVVRRMIVEYALDYFEKNPEQDTVSIEPSDHTGWCECSECRDIGTPSDHMAILANEVIEEVRKQYPNKYVAFYAYNHHSAPPKYKLKPGIITAVTTGLRFGGAGSFDDVVKGWVAQGATSGVRDYASLVSYDSNGIPYYSRAGRVQDYVDALKGYHDFGFQFYRTEMNDSWGPNGLGYYLGARVLWDRTAAENVEQVVDEFLTLSFGSAKEPMRRFYELTTGINNISVSPFDAVYISNLFKLLEESWQSSNDEDVRNRIGDLILYVHYLSLYDDYLKVSEPERDALLEKALRFSYRLYPTHMVDSRGLWSSKFKSNLIPDRVTPDNVDAKVPEGENPWKDTTPFTLPEIEGILENGVSRELAQPTQWKIIPVLRKEENNPQMRSSFRMRGPNRILIYALKDGEIKVSTGRYEDSFFDYRRSFKITDSAGELIAVADDEVKFQGKEGEVYEYFSHISPHTGSYQVNIEGAPAAVRSDMYYGQLFQFTNSARLFAYIPENTPEWNFWIRTGGKGETVKVLVKDPSGKQIDEMESGETHEFDRQYPGAEGFWEVSLSNASTGIPYKRLMRFEGGVSPWISITPGYLLKVESQD